VTEESRDRVAPTPPAPIGAEGEGMSTDKLFEPPEHVAAEDESPSTPESTDTVVPRTREPREGRDRGHTIALGTLGGLVALGLVLIARGPQTPSSQEPAPREVPAVLTSAALVPPASAPAATVLAPASSSSATAQADAGPKFTPAWRVAALEHEPGVEVVRGTLGKHTLAGALAQAGLPKIEVRRVTHSVDNIRRIEHGVSKDTFVVARDRSKGTVLAFEYVASPTDVWQAKSEDGLVTKKLELFVEKKRSQAALVVTADLAKAIAAAGLREEAIEEIDDALEGHGDAAVIKPGVRLRVVGSEEWVEGTFARFHVDAVEYVPKTGSSLRVYFYERDASALGSHRRMPHPGFYDAKGQQPFRGTFRSPVPLARVTSRFNPKRLHPVLHVVMPHNGIDFGASTGTPVFAASSGTVHSAGDGGPCGNMVQIEHASGLTTAYCHLSRFAPGLHPGQHVEARQLVGYVGQTGRVTGPHLHFAVKRGGNFIDPMALKMDGVRTLPPADRDAFAKKRAELDAALEAVTLPSADGVVVPDDKDENKDEPGGEE
jgi:murein DD-endopeptidase MepM/ murein hydrolase activator NlpD